jgi:hypothetical protein
MCKVDGKDHDANPTSFSARESKNAISDPEWTPVPATDPEAETDTGLLLDSGGLFGKRRI